MSGNKKAREGMSRFGINTDRAFGVSIPVLRGIAKKTGRNRELALRLWASGYHEARILASMVDVPEEVATKQMDDWTAEFNSWDLCDQVIQNLFEKTSCALSKAYEWCEREEEFVKRAGFVMIARLAVSDKTAADKMFLDMFPALEKGALDERNFVKKAVNWAVRQIGKRNAFLNRKAIRLAKKLARINSRPARWIAQNTLQELESEQVQARLRK